MENTTPISFQQALSQFPQALQSLYEIDREEGTLEIFNKDPDAFFQEWCLDEEVQLAYNFHSSGDTLEYHEVGGPSDAWMVWYPDENEWMPEDAECEDAEENEYDDE